MRELPAVVAGLLFLAACTTESGGEVTRTLPPTETTVPSTSAEEPAADEPIDLPAVPPGDAIVDGRANQLILVLDAEEGSLTVVQVDGSPVTTLADDDGRVVLQPAWSPDGRRVAWARSSDGVAWELVHAAVDGSDERAVALPGRPDYIAFDPTASRLTALTPSPVGFGLVVVELSGDGPAEPRLVDVGRPYFTDFSPAGDRVVAHAGTDVRVVDLLDGEGVPQSLADPSTTHQTPQWHPSDDRVVYTVDGDTGRGRLVQRRLDEDDESLLAEFGGFLFFDLDPTGERLAVSSIPAPAEPGTPQALRRQDGLPAGLSVVDLDGGSTSLTTDPTSAPVWDPTGTRVLVRDALAGVGRWTVHHVDERRAEVTDPLSVDESQMPLYLRFWDQYVRSHTVWSPDGAHFVHVGTAADGRSGVWVHDAESSGPSAFLVAGDLALWSPT